MIVAASSACILTGIALAAASLRDRSRAPLLELCSGFCLVAGLGLLGASLHLWR